MKTTIFSIFLTQFIFSNTPAEIIKVGAAKRIITPDRSVYLAGWGSNRQSEGVHDDLFVRCIVITDGETEIGFLSADLLGLTRLQIETIRSKCRDRGVSAENVIMMATHQHSGPDTIGLWGPTEDESGVDEEVIEFICDQSTDAIVEAFANLKPAKIAIGSTKISAEDRISVNHCEPDLIDREIGIIKCDDQEGKTIATLINFAMHPEVMKFDNKLLTADFPGVIYRECDQKLGGITLFANGALGGMVSPDRESATWKEVDRIGGFIAEKVIQTTQNLEIQKSPIIRHTSKTFDVPMENQNFLAAIEVGLLPRGMLNDGKMPTTVHVIRIGDAQIATFPGEVLPKLGFRVKSAMSAKHKFVFGLVDDELGYILAEEDFSLELYKYERSMSVGSSVGTLTTTAILELLSEE